MNNAEENNEVILIYEWVDSMPLSRSKKNITRDFSDGVLMAEIMKNSLPGLVELHNYSTAHSSPQKLYNWNTLNRILNYCYSIEKVFKKIGFQLSKKEIDGIVSCQSGVIESVLKKVYEKLHHTSLKDSVTGEIKELNKNKNDFSQNAEKQNEQNK